MTDKRQKTAKVKCKRGEYLTKHRRHRRGSRINTDRFPILGRSGGMLPRVIFWILTPQSPLSWVSESFRQDIYWLSKPFSRFQLGRFKVFTKNISIMKYLTDFRKTVETGMDPRPSQYVRNIVFSRRSINEFSWSSFADERNSFPKSNRKNVKLNKFAFGTPWISDLLCRHWFTSSAWNFCRWVPPRWVPRRWARRNVCRSQSNLLFVKFDHPRTDYPPPNLTYCNA